MTPVICLITDRKRLGPLWEAALVERVRAAAHAGVHLIQLRERDLDGGPLLRLVSACLEAVRGTRTRVLVNDRIDVAIAAGAHGVHLRSDSCDARRVRTWAPAGFLLGRSVHSVEEASAADATDALDYLVFGTVFETPSKLGRAAAGLGELARVAATTRLPVLAVGGVTLERTADIMATGASGVAGISLFDTLGRVP